MGMLVTKNMRDNVKAKNEEKIKELYHKFVPKVRAIIKDLEGHGYIPLIVWAWRSPEEQERLYKQGSTKIKYGFHNVSDRLGGPEAMAVDIVDARYMYNAPKRFWLMLASSALAHGCESGVLWTGSNILLRNRIMKAIKERDFSYNGPLGWDCAHVQMLPNSKLAAVRKGWRP